MPIIIPPGLRRKYPNNAVGLDGATVNPGSNTVLIGLNVGSPNALNSVILGNGAGSAKTTGNENQESVVIGTYAGKYPGGRNVFIGHNSGNNSAAISADNVCIGDRTGEDISGLANTIIGARAGNTVGSSQRNTIIGFLSGGGLTTGSYNTLTGAELLVSGNSARNTLTGYRAGANLSDAYDNAYFGYQAGQSNAGDFNVFIGSGAGDVITSGNRNILIGYKAGSSLAGTTNDIFEISSNGTILMQGDFTTGAVTFAGSISVPGGIAGGGFEIVSSDPANPTAGQSWYNTTENVAKIYYGNNNAWTVGEPMLAYMSQSAGSGTGKTSFILAGGYNAGSGSSEAWTFDGTAWTSIANMPTSTIDTGAVGNSANAVVMVGADATSWDGAAWTTVAASLTARTETRSFIGGTTAAKLNGGYDSAAGGSSAICEDFDGATWASAANMNVARREHSGAGTLTNALTIGTSDSGTPGYTSETWDGSAWTNQPDDTIYRGASGFMGDAGEGVVAGGGNPGQNDTSYWDGTTWDASQPTLPDTRSLMAYGGSYSDGVFSTGRDADANYNNETFYWAGFPPGGIKTFTVT